MCLIVLLSTTCNSGSECKATDTWQLGSIDRASTTQQVLYELREAIIDGRIAQGEALREVSLAKTFGTGRSAVREAIRQLEQEGLVVYELHRGALVRVMSLADRLDVYVAREAIEAGVEAVVEAFEPADLSRLRAPSRTCARRPRGTTA